MFSLQIQLTKLRTNPTHLLQDLVTISQQLYFKTCFILVYGFNIYIYLASSFAFIFFAIVIKTVVSLWGNLWCFPIWEKLGERMWIFLRALIDIAQFHLLTGDNELILYSGMWKSQPIWMTVKEEALYTDLSQMWAELCRGLKKEP